jgi:alkaline phosphatase D
VQNLPKRIAFGSCAKQDKPQPIWNAVLASDPDLFIFLGDNIYGDTRDMAVLRRKYAELAAQPGFVRLTERTPILATWDDHDYGENDAGVDYPFKDESRQIFCDFWG